MSHLIGAFGLFWRREEVNWSAPGWQLLGYRNTRRPALRVCDFRKTRGIYLLFNDYGAHYVGLARGNEGIGSRLHEHDQDGDKDWDRFAWFAFDDVVDSDLPGWSAVRLRDAVAEVDSTTTVREFEALLIQVLGTHRTGSNRQAMRFLEGDRWEQLTFQSGVGNGLVRRVDPAGFRDRAWWTDALGD